MSEKMNVGQRLCYEREKRNLSLEKLADGINKKFAKENLKFGKSTISKWESGNNQPTFDSIIKTCQYLNISLDYLAGLDESKNYAVKEIPVYKEYRNTDNNKIINSKYLSSYSVYTNDNMFYLELENTTYLVNKDIEFKSGNTGLFKTPNTDNTVIRKGQIFDGNILLTDEKGEQNLYKSNEVELIGVVVSKEIKMI